MASVVEVATVLLLLFSLGVPKKLHLFFLFVDDWGWANASYNCDTPTKGGGYLEFQQSGKRRAVIRSPLHVPCTKCALQWVARCWLEGYMYVYMWMTTPQLKLTTYYNPQNSVSGFQGIPWNMTMIAERLKSAWYATHQVGKWDTGMHGHTGGRVLLYMVRVCVVAYALIC